jgi:hypothetical protein
MPPEIDGSLVTALPDDDGEENTERDRIRSDSPPDQL